MKKAVHQILLMQRVLTLKKAKKKLKMAIRKKTRRIKKMRRVLKKTASLEMLTSQKLDTTSHTA
jgi:hypothetical protein